MVDNKSKKSEVKKKVTRKSAVDSKKNTEKTANLKKRSANLKPPWKK